MAIGPLALLDLPDPCLLGSDDDVVAYRLMARILTPPDAPAEWNEPTPVACIDLRAAVGSRFDAGSLSDWERRANEALGQDEECKSVSATLALDDDKVLRCLVEGVGAEGPFRFEIAIDGVTAELLRGP